MKQKIDLDQKLELKGYWYLPTDPQNRVAGILTYYPNEKIMLELIGCFGEYTLAIFNKRDEEEIIYGRTEDGKDVTLINNIRALKVNFSADFPIVRYTCNFMVIGRHIKGLDEKRNYWATARMPELTLWSPPGALTTTLLFGKNKDSVDHVCLSFSTEYRSRKNIICHVNVNDNTSIKIMKGVYYNGDHLAPVVKQYSYLEVRKKEKSSIKELLTDIFVYEQFLSLATLSITKSSKITLFDRNIYQQEGKKRFYREIHIIHAFTEMKNLEQQTITKFRPLFDYAAIKDFYPEILRKWYNEPLELAPIRSHLISSLEKKQVYSSVDFLIVIQALEGFCRRFRSKKYRKEHGLPERDYSELFEIMNSLIDEFGDIDLIKKCEINIDAVVDSRNYYSHFMPMKDKPNTLDGFELYDLTTRLRILLICCVLNLFGFTNIQINEILKKSNSKVLQLK